MACTKATSENCLPTVSVHKDCLMSFLSIDDTQTYKACHHQPNLIDFKIFVTFISIFCIYMSQTNDYTQNLIESVTLH